jgi:hypothetical protein
MKRVMTRSRSTNPVTALVLALAGCSGEIERDPLWLSAGGAGAGALAGGPGGSPPGTSGTDGLAGSAAQAPVDPNACLPRVPQRLVLLSDLQHANSVSSALGETARDPGLRLSADTKPFSQKGLVVSTSLVHDRLDQAQFAAASLDTRFTEVTGCPMTG